MPKAHAHIKASESLAAASSVSQFFTTLFPIESCSNAALLFMVMDGM
jgi:hypothetical protein